MAKNKWMWIGWPSFLVAAGLEMLVFSLVDPQDLQWFGRPLTLSRQAVYTLAFFVFWALVATSSALAGSKHPDGASRRSHSGTSSPPCAVIGMRVARHSSGRSPAIPGRNP